MIKNEIQAIQEYEKRGYRVLKNGWPDFLAYREIDGKLEVVAVEVKAGTDTVKPEQRENHKILHQLGIPVDVYWVESPASGTPHFGTSKLGEYKKLILKLAADPAVTQEQAVLKLQELGAPITIHNLAAFIYRSNILWVKSNRKSRKFNELQTSEKSS